MGGVAGSDILKLIGSVGGGAIESAFAPSPFQQRQSFSGSSADPTLGLTQIQNTLRGLLGGAIDKVGQGVDLPDAHVGSLPSFSGGGMPMPIGVPSVGDAGHGDLSQGYHLPGLNLPGSAGTSGLPTSPLNTGLPKGRADTGLPVGTNPWMGQPWQAGYVDPNGDPSTKGGTPLPKAPAGSPSTLINSPTGAGGVQGSQLLPLDDQTQGALQLLFHAAMSGQGQQQQGAA